VLPIWEGTTNVLALDTLRALQSGDHDLNRGLARFESAVMSCLQDAADANRIARSALDHAANWLNEAMRAGRPALEAGARRFSLTLGRIMEFALLVKHAKWSKEHENDERAAAAARRFAALGIDLIGEYDVQDVNALL